MNDISTIVTRENKALCIAKLAAQRQIYSNAKILFGVQTFISVMLLALLSFAQLILPTIDFTLIIATVSILAVFTDDFLERRINKLKESATKIQELFDTYVLNIKWNSILCQDKPEYDDICDYFTKYNQKHDLAELHDWYETEIETIPENKGVIICQKTNCNYDSKIRKKYNSVILTIGIITIILILLFTIFSDVTLSKIMLTVFFPALPIIQWTYKNIMANKESIAIIERLRSLVNSAWEDIREGQTIADDRIRQIQDSIFLNRKGNPLVFDFIYNKLRNKLETQIHYTVSQLINELDNNR
ncbi:hypothetical protein FACS189435_4120 [Bacteroidia bacterium]|nr:hypothetical protein FACS189435_4120 [Bacteroidia bacterium]